MYFYLSLPAILARLVQVTQSNRHGSHMLQCSFIHYHFYALYMQLTYRKIQWAWEPFLSRECSKLSLIRCIANSEHQGKPSITWSLIFLLAVNKGGGKPEFLFVFLLWCSCPPVRKLQLAVGINKLEGLWRGSHNGSCPECCFWTSYHPHRAESKPSL